MVALSSEMILHSSVKDSALADQNIICGEPPAISDNRSVRTDPSRNEDVDKREDEEDDDSCSVMTEVRDDGGAEFSYNGGDSNQQNTPRPAVDEVRRNYAEAVMIKAIEVNIKGTTTIANSKSSMSEIQSELTTSFLDLDVQENKKVYCDEIPHDQPMMKAPLSCLGPELESGFKQFTTKVSSVVGSASATTTSGLNLKLAEGVLEKLRLLISPNEDQDKTKAADREPHDKDIGSMRWTGDGVYAAGAETSEKEKAARLVMEKWHELSKILKQVASKYLAERYASLSFEESKAVIENGGEVPKEADVGDNAVPTSEGVRQGKRAKSASVASSKKKSVQSSRLSLLLKKASRTSSRGKVLEENVVFPEIDVPAAVSSLSEASSKSSDLVPKEDKSWTGSGVVDQVSKDVELLLRLDEVSKAISSISSRCSSGTPSFLDNVDGEVVSHLKELYDLVDEMARENEGMKAVLKELKAKLHDMDTIRRENEELKKKMQEEKKLRDES